MCLETAYWFLVRNGGMGYWDYYRGTLRDCHRDPFPPFPTHVGTLKGWWFLCLGVLTVKASVLDSF